MISIRSKDSSQLAILLLTDVFVAIALLIVPCIYNAAWAQTNKLPKAQFQRFTDTSDQGGLQPVNGVHLTDGLDRPSSSGPAVPYNPGEPQANMQLVRWERKKMPILIWISPGIMLPSCSFNQIQHIRPDQVYQLLKQSDPFLGLKTAPGWTPETNYQVAAGIEEWRQFEDEGLFSFAFTDNPKDAHVLVFFTDAFREDDAPGGIKIGGITSAKILPIAQAKEISEKYGQFPVVIELSTFVNDTPEKMSPAAAHEFGHALGIKSHSPYRQDLMYVDRVVQHLSPADKATIRALYRAQPQWVM